jgi:ABC-2 type transport system permease protein
VSQPAVELREVRGPSALGGGWRRTLELLYIIAVNDFKRTYFGTVLGYLWSLVRPLLLFGVLLAVFTHLVRFASVHHYTVLLLLNLVLFGFFSEATGQATASVVNQENVVRKTQFPRLVIPLSVVLMSLFNLAINLVVTFAFILGFGVAPRWSWLLLGLVLLGLLIYTTAVAMILASLFPRFRDVGIIWTVLATALFYATPVLYPLQRVHGTIGNLIAANPLTPLLELARRWVIDPRAPLTGGLLHILVPAVIYAAVCVIAVWTFGREAPRIAESL